MMDKKIVIISSMIKWRKKEIIILKTLNGTGMNSKMCKWEVYLYVYKGGLKSSYDNIISAFDDLFDQ